MHFHAFVYFVTPLPPLQPFIIICDFQDSIQKKLRSHRFLSKLADNLMIIR